MENKNMKNKLEAYKKELELASSNLSHSDFIKVYQQNKTKSKAKTLPKRRIFKQYIVKNI